MMRPLGAHAPRSESRRSERSASSTAGGEAVVAACGRLSVVVLAAVVACAAPAAAAPAAGGSLYSGRGHRPGPDILYAKPAVAPQLQNGGVWKAPPILISGATAYRNGEFLYQDWLYDDHGAKEVQDPNDPKAANLADLFSKSNGTYTYPSGPGYDNNAADVVEFRAKPLATATAFRITLNTLTNPSLIAFSIAIGGTPGQTHPFPDGANVSAPASMFLTVHPSGGSLVAELTNATTGQPVAGGAPTVHVDMTRRQIEVDVPHGAWNPGPQTVRLAMGVGLWNGATHSYLLPQATRSATTPGGAGPLALLPVGAGPAAFFNVAFRHEPTEPVVPPEFVAVNPAWWSDSAQGAALANHDISPMFVNVDFGKLQHNVTDNSGVPTAGAMDRILASHFSLGQGAQFVNECGLNGATKPSSCTPEYLGQLQPYAIYIPATGVPKTGYGMTLLLHSLSANYNQYSGTRNQAQFGNRARPSIVITPEARGPDQFYAGYAGAEVFEVWADLARRYHLNPAYSEITGYSMGGFGTFRLGSQFPDLFARAQPTVGEEANTDVLASLRNIPVLMWNGAVDELVPAAEYEPTASKLQSLGYRYELDVFQTCPAVPVPQNCSPLFPGHLTLATNDQFGPAASFLDTSLVNFNPAHVTYVEDTARNFPTAGLNGDHAYWLSGLTIRSPAHTSSNGEPEGEIDAFSHGFGFGNPTASGQKLGTGTLTGGNLGTLSFARQFQAWGPRPNIAKADVINIVATNVATVTIDARRAHVDCHVKLHITSDGPIHVRVADCTAKSTTRKRKPATHQAPAPPRFTG
jgi:hypothetical protein